MKKLVTIVLVLAMIFVLCSCNKTLFDTQYHFNYAIIALPNGDVVEGKVDSWTDFEDGDQLQVKIEGIVYLVHSSNIGVDGEIVWKIIFSVVAVENYFIDGMVNR